jgi:hypothetical protein
MKMEEKYNELLNRYAGLMICRTCLRVKNCEVCHYNTLERQDVYSDNFVQDYDKTAVYNKKLI